VLTKYLEVMRTKNRAVRANREKSCLSACYTWLLLQEESGVRLNPCAGIKRNPESKRTRYVTDDELSAMMRTLHDAPAQSKGSAKSVRALLMLVYRTLQRPEDILRWTPQNIIEMNGKRVIRSPQQKLKGRTDVVVYLEVTPEIEGILDELGACMNSLMPLIHRRDGHPYTYSGLTAIMQRYRTKAQKLRPRMESCWFY
jgi:integrase